MAKGIEADALVDRVDMSLEHREINGVHFLDVWTASSPDDELVALGRGVTRAEAVTQCAERLRVMLNAVGKEL